MRCFDLLASTDTRDVINDPINCRISGISSRAHKLDPTNQPSCFQYHVRDIERNSECTGVGQLGLACDTRDWDFYLC